MKTTVWLRVAALLSLLFAAGHFIGGMGNWSPVPDNPVLQAMRTVRFDVMGVSRSYLDFYLGFGHSLTVSMLLQAVLLWMMSDAARTQVSFVRPMIAAFAVAGALTGLIALKYIFLVPALFSFVLCATLVVALLTARSSPMAANATA